MKEFFADNQPTIVSSDRILYTASSFARGALLHLQEIGELKALKAHTSSRNDLQSYLFFVVMKGSGVLIYQNQKYTLTPGSCVFIDCRNPYAHSTGTEDGESDLWNLRWCHFYGPTMGSVYHKYIERGGRPFFMPPSIQPFTDVLDELMCMAKSSDYMRDMKINSALSNLLLQIMEQSWHPENRRRAPKRASLTEVKNWIDEHFSEHISLEELSKTFYIDKFYMAKSFKAQYGQTIASYITNIRITKAKQLLRFSDMTIEEISGQIGISDPAYFSRVFREIEGVGPRKYREQW